VTNETTFAALDDRLERLGRAFGEEFLARVRQRTPVLTGTLQAGWTLTTTPQEVTILNEVDYGPYVEYGTPRMAPRAMMRTTALEADDILRTAAARVGL